MQWNELDYSVQQKVMGLIEELLLKQTDIEIQDGMVAALTELEVWSNSPCLTTDDWPYSYIAQAMGQDEND